MLSYISGSRGAALYLDKNRKKLQLISLPPCSNALISSVTESRLSILSKAENELENTIKAYFQGENKFLPEHGRGLLHLKQAYKRLLAERVLRSGCDPETIRTFASLRTIYARTGQTTDLETLRNQFERLFRKESSIARPEATFLDLLHLAAISGSPDSLQFLVDTGSPVNAPFVSELTAFYEYTALHCAVYGANTVAINWLLHNGADVSAKTAGGQTSLHIAISNRLTSHVSYEIVRLLLTNVPEGAEFLNAADNTGMTVLDLAKKAGAQDTVQLLKHYGATENLRVEVRFWYSLSCFRLC